MQEDFTFGVTAHAVEQVVLDTTLVTLSIGGNDKNAFSNAVQACALSPTDCGTDSFFATYEGDIDDDQALIIATVQEIRQKAPEAAILFVTYPRPVSLSQGCVDALGITGSDPTTLAMLADYLNGEDSFSLVGTGMPKPAFVSPIADFSNHGVYDSDPWIKGVTVGPNSDGDFHAGDPTASCLWKFDTCVSRESFHRNTAGTTGYEHIVERKLTQMGYIGA